MVGKSKPMSQVKQILRMREKCKGIKTIVRSLQISKNTVKEYLKKVEDSTLEKGCFQAIRPIKTSAMNSLKIA